VLTQVATGVLVHESGFCQSSAVVVQGRAGVLLIDPGVLGDEMAGLANDLRELGRWTQATSVSWSPGHGSTAEAGQVRARIDQDLAYVHGLRDAQVPGDRGLARRPSLAGTG
jgi:hypothetical protein